MYYYQTKVKKGSRGAYYFTEPSTYKRYVGIFDIKTRKIPNIFPSLPRSINDKIWHYKRNLECADENWDVFIMCLTAQQYRRFHKKAKFKRLHRKDYIRFALANFSEESRIHYKACRQLLNY